ISSDGNFAPWMLALGAHTVNAVATDAANGAGRPGEPLEIDFTLVRSGLGAAGAGPRGDVPSAGAFGVGAQAGAPVGLPVAGTGVSVNSALVAGRPAASQSRPLQSPPPPGCTCRVPGAGVGSAGTPGAWALAALALGLFVRRRRVRDRSA